MFKIPLPRQFLAQQTVRLHSSIHPHFSPFCPDGGAPRSPRHDCQTAPARRLPREISRIKKEKAPKGFWPVRRFLALVTSSCKNSPVVPSYPLAKIGQANFEIRLSIALVIRETPRQPRS